VNIFIPNDFIPGLSKKELFSLARPFATDKGWGNERQLLTSWGIDEKVCRYVEDISKASVMVLPYAVNTYMVADKQAWLDGYSLLCRKHGIKCLAFVSGDWGRAYPEFECITYFRPSGFRSQLSARNQGFPIALSDHLNRYNNLDRIQIRQKSEVPVVGFCGHASFSLTKLLKEKSKFLFENIDRGWRNPFRRDWEPLFPSAFYRAKLLRLLERSPGIKTNFIYRDRYRAGAITEHEKELTTEEYYNNLLDSDYVLCVRGGGNFSVRFYETLMMGRIPVFVNTDCLVPFPDKIPWKEHVVWIEWKDRHKMADRIFTFHKKLSNNQFADLQHRNRNLWKETLSVTGIYKLVMNVGLDNGA
jgi:Exostosin family